MEKVSAFAIAARSAGVKHFLYLPALIRPAPEITNRSIMEKTKNTKASNGRVGFISLGCRKALVDSERTLTQLREPDLSMAASLDAGIV